MRRRFVLRSLLIPPLLALLPLASSTAPAKTPIGPLPLKQNGGTWNSGHVQGIAIDLRGGFIYYSFTNLLVKYDFSGRLIGTLSGWTGHLGDLDFNPADGRVYGSLEYKKNASFYIARIDVARLDSVGMDARRTDIIRTIYLPEVARDYAADLDGDGIVKDEPSSSDHRYGCSGIDGVAFGPAFGRIDGARLLTVAYGIYGNTTRADNDHQILLQYDVADWARYSQRLAESRPHQSGPATPAGKYFVRTGNTTYGVQNLAYDEDLHRWFMGVYQGTKTTFPNYLLFSVNARERPVTSDLVGVRRPEDASKERGRLLRLTNAGLKDRATGLRGWMQKADVGLQPVGKGLFYLAVNRGLKGRQTADIRLVRWTGDRQQPFGYVD
jgi:hypothetical protein